MAIMWYTPPLLHFNNLFLGLEYYGSTWRSEVPNTCPLFFCCSPRCAQVFKTTISMTQERCLQFHLQLVCEWPVIPIQSISKQTVRHSLGQKSKFRLVHANTMLDERPGDMC